MGYFDFVSLSLLRLVAAQVCTYADVQIDGMHFLASSTYRRD